MTKPRGFTMVEILIIIAILGILLAVAILGYGAWSRNIATTAAKSDLNMAVTALKSYKNFSNSYPPNMAGTSFASSPHTAVTLYTNAPSLGVYSNLTDDQNAQLFLNVCNANLSGTNSTSCVFQGNGNGAKIHVKGTTGTNAIWPTDVDQNEVVISCGAACNTATANMISQFLAQGGHFPVKVPGNNVSLPTPDQVPNGPATEYCVQSQSSEFADIVYHSTETDDGASSGVCADASLHYYP